MFPAVGWVRADKISNEELLLEINELRKKNAELSKALSEIEPSIFTGSEEKDYSYIYNKLNRLENIEITIRIDKTEKYKIITQKYSINLASLIPFISTSNTPIFHWSSISAKILDQLFPDRAKDRSKTFSVSGLNNLTDELKMYGLLKIIYRPPASETGLQSFLSRQGSYQLNYSEKLDRYKYWLNINGIMPEDIEINEEIRAQ